MFGYTFMKFLCILILYYLVGCIVKIVGISSNSDTVNKFGTGIFYFPIVLTTLLISLVFMVFSVTISTICRIKDIVCVRFLYCGRIKEARRLMKEIEAEENDLDDEDNRV